jgi:large subunit ribosomal protein L25
MVKEIKLDVQTRVEKDGKAKKIRKDGFIPAVIYGSGMAVRNLKVKQRDFEQIFALAGEANLIDLAIDGQETIKAIIKDVHIDPIRDKIVHADFYKVDMKKEIEVEVPLNFIGEAKAVKELDGILVKNIDGIEIKCLPGNLIEKIEVNLSILETFADAIRVKDLKLPSDIEVMNQPEDLVVHVIEPQKEEDPVVEEEKVEGEEGEEKKEEGEEIDKKEGADEEEKKEEKKEKQ